MKSIITSLIVHRIFDLARIFFLLDGKHHKWLRYDLQMIEKHFNSDGMDYGKYRGSVTKKEWFFFCMYRSNQNTDQILLSEDWVDSDIPVI